MQANSDAMERTVRLLSDLIALETVNPMGRAYDGKEPVERPVVEYLERLLAPLGVSLERQTCSPIHESLLVTLPGRSSGPGTLLEAHIDTVPADDWRDRAFVPRVADGKVFGRGACDDKGSLAAMVLALLSVLESGMQPPSTVWLLAAADEEYGQCGIRHFVSHHQHQIGRAIIGEPTDAIPVIEQKGVIRWDITVFGHSAHTSQPENGRNSILDMLRVIAELGQHEADLQRRFRNPRMTGPTISVTMIHGGRTRNAVPDECTIAVDFRPLPEMDGQQAMEELKGRLHALGIPLAHSDYQCNIPGLRTSAEDPFVKRLVALCSERLGRTVAPAGVPYGSDACWIPSSASTVVLGPGNIGSAHAVDEHVEIEQVEHCAAVFRQVMLD